VRRARCACGAADAYMNPRLSETTKDQYLVAFNYHYCETLPRLRQAIDEFKAKVQVGKHPDVMPLYIVSFLLHAAGVS
jgi:hypothetical protein